VITIVVVGGVALVVVIVTRGSFTRLFRLPIQSIWMVLVALAIQIFLAFVEIPSDRFDDLGLVLVMASYAFLLAFCLVNLRISMMWVIGLGIALNALVIGLNHGMPTIDNEVTTRSGRTIEEPIERTARHRPESDDDLLPFLGDRLRVPDPVDEVISIGDLVIGLGIILVCYQGSRVRRPTRSRRSERTARIAARLRQRESPSQERVQERVQEPVPVPVQDPVPEPVQAQEPAPVQDPVPEQEPVPVQEHVPVQEQEPVPQQEPAPLEEPAPVQEPVQVQDQEHVQEPVPQPTSTKDEHALSHDSPDDTLGVELNEVFARLAADDHAGDAPKEHGTDEPHEA
jgi:Family of unknown function (DUF5317)